MVEKYTAARLAVAVESPCSEYAARLEHRKLMQGIELAQKSLTRHSSLHKTFYRLKAIEKLTAVALQNVYPKGKRYAILVLKLLSEN